MNRNKVYIYELILQINHLSFLKINKDLESEGLTASQARVLYYLYEAEGTIQSQIQKYLSIKSSSLTRLIDTLEKKGLVVRRTTTEDARTKKIFLTPEGNNKKEKLFEARDETEDDITKPLSPDECNELIASLTKIQKALLKYQ
ncbi:MarR family winged helix-turn-helix transcriptional regulator [Peribacillus butanolivorans]|uniref:MarR family winged helix-turn-helix transcriptional regulator n=1 Tax=Peribacillus butanolivorans TaxID=421767 RepID=UPI00366EEBD8